MRLHSCAVLALAAIFLQQCSVAAAPMPAPLLGVLDDISRSASGIGNKMSDGVSALADGTKGLGSKMHSAPDIPTSGFRPNSFSGHMTTNPSLGTSLPRSAGFPNGVLQSRPDAELVQAQQHLDGLQQMVGNVKPADRHVTSGPNRILGEPVPQGSRARKGIVQWAPGTSETLEPGKVPTGRVPGLKSPVRSSMRSTDYVPVVAPFKKPGRLQALWDLRGGYRNAIGLFVSRGKVVLRNIISLFMTRSRVAARGPMRVAPTA